LPPAQGAPALRRHRDRTSVELISSNSPSVQPRDRASSSGAWNAPRGRSSQYSDCSPIEGRSRAARLQSVPPHPARIQAHPRFGKVFPCLARSPEQPASLTAAAIRSPASCTIASRCSISNVVLLVRQHRGNTASTASQSPAPPVSPRAPASAGETPPLAARATSPHTRPADDLRFENNIGAIMGKGWIAPRQVVIRPGEAAAGSPSV
jgi:hypothetical protein